MVVAVTQFVEALLIATLLVLFTSPHLLNLAQTSQNTFNFIHLF